MIFFKVFVITIAFFFSSSLAQTNTWKNENIVTCLQNIEAVVDRMADLIIMRLQSETITENSLIEVGGEVKQILQNIDLASKACPLDSVVIDFRRLTELNHYLQFWYESKKMAITEALGIPKDDSTAVVYFKQ